MSFAISKNQKALLSQPNYVEALTLSHKFSSQRNFFDC